MQMNWDQGDELIVTDTSKPNQLKVCYKFKWIQHLVLRQQYLQIPVEWYGCAAKVFIENAKENFSNVHSPKFTEHSSLGNTKLKVMIVVGCNYRHCSSLHVFQVRNTRGEEGYIPSLSCLLPSPDINAANAIER